MIDPNLLIVTGMLVIGINSSFKLDLKHENFAGKVRKITTRLSWLTIGLFVLVIGCKMKIGG